jgi:hypothetical protein
VALLVGTNAGIDDGLFHFVKKLMFLGRLFGPAWTLDSVGFLVVDFQG